MNSVVQIASTIPLRQRKKVPGRHGEAKLDPGTHETALKLIPDHIKSLRQEHQEAAAAINRAYSIVCAKALSRAANFEPRTSPSKEAPLNPESKKAKLLNAWWVWQRDMKRRQLKISPIIDMIVDGMAPWEVDRRRGWLPGLAAMRLLEALETYLRADR